MTDAFFVGIIRDELQNNLITSTDDAKKLTLLNQILIIGQLTKLPPYREVTNR
jgi:hypothetical protein